MIFVMYEEEDLDTFNVYINKYFRDISCFDTSLIVNQVIDQKK